MIEVFIAVLLIILICWYVFDKLESTNLPPWEDYSQAEIPVPDGCDWTGSPGIGHNGGPPIETWHDSCDNAKREGY